MTNMKKAINFPLLPITKNKMSWHKFYIETPDNINIVQFLKHKI